MKAAHITPITTPVANIATPVMKAELTREIKAIREQIAERRGCMERQQRVDSDLIFFYHLGERYTIFQLERQERDLFLMEHKRKMMDAKPTKLVTN